MKPFKLEQDSDLFEKLSCWTWDPMVNPRGECDEERLWEY